MGSIREMHAVHKTLNESIEKLKDIQCNQEGLVHLQYCSGWSCDYGLILFFVIDSKVFLRIPQLKHLCIPFV